VAGYSRGVHEVGDGVFAYLQPDGSWGWSNAGLVAGDRTSCLVDTLFDLRLTQVMLDELRATTPTATRIATLVNTHANGDHCFGNQLVGGAEIVASTACAEEMRDAPPERLAGLVDAAADLGRVGAYFARIFGPFEFHDITLTLPTRTFDGELEVGVDGRVIRLIEVGPAHTRGDVIVHVPSAGVVFTGDILFVGGHPIVWAGPVRNWVAALDRVLALDADTIVPGHGPVTDAAGVRELRAYFVDLQEQAGACFEAGLDPLEAARHLRLEPYASWTDGERVVANIAAIYRELASSAGRESAATDGAPAAGVFAQMAELAGA
jgi:glyoxylase-like metal-dependent hydrolase (beta-lactamase superfamily II)